MQAIPMLRKKGDTQAIVPALISVSSACRLGDLGLCAACPLSQSPDRMAWQLSSSTKRSRFPFAKWSEHCKWHLWLWDSGMSVERAEPA